MAAVLRALLPFLAVLAASAQPPGTVPFPPDIIAGDTFRDAAKIDPAHFKIDLENDRVRVLHLKLKGDEAVPTHDLRPGLIVCLNECHVRFTRPDKHIVDVHLVAGESRWMWEDTYSEKNLSSRPLELLFVEQK